MGSRLGLRGPSSSSHPVAILVAPATDALLGVASRLLEPTGTTMKTVILTLLAIPPVALAFHSAPPPSPEPVASAAATTYAVDGVHSSILYKVRHMGVSNFYGSFGSIGGELVYDAKDPSASSIRIEIDAKSVDSRNEKRDAHLRSTDFFNASEFPTIVFESTKVEGKGDELTIQGNLELRGTERPVTAKAVKIGEAAGEHGKLVGFEARFTFDAAEFGLNYVDQMPETVLGREIEVVVALECKARE